MQSVSPYENCCSVVDGESLIYRTVTYNITFSDRAFKDPPLKHAMILQNYVQAFRDRILDRPPLRFIFQLICILPTHARAWIIDDERCTFKPPAKVEVFVKIANAATGNECSGPGSIFHPLPILDKLQLVVDGCDFVTTPAPISTPAPITNAEPTTSTAPTNAVTLWGVSYSLLAKVSTRIVVVIDVQAA